MSCQASSCAAGFSIVADRNHVVSQHALMLKSGANILALIKGKSCELKQHETSCYDCCLSRLLLEAFWKNIFEWYNDRDQIRRLDSSLVASSDMAMHDSRIAVSCSSCGCSGPVKPPAAQQDAAAWSHVLLTRCCAGGGVAAMPGALLPLYLRRQNVLVANPHDGYICAELCRLICLESLRNVLLSRGPDLGQFRGRWCCSREFEVTITSVSSGVS